MQKAQRSSAVLSAAGNICNKYIWVKNKWSSFALVRGKKKKKKCLYWVLNQRMRKNEMEQSIWEHISNATVVAVMPSIFWPFHCPSSASLPTGSSELYPEVIRTHAHFLMMRMAKNKVCTQITPFHNHLSGSFLFTEKSHNEHIRLLIITHVPFLASCSCLHCIALSGIDNIVTQTCSWSHRLNVQPCAIMGLIGSCRANKIINTPAISSPLWPVICHVVNHSVLLCFFTFCAHFWESVWECNCKNKMLSCTAFARLKCNKQYTK